MRMQLAVAGVVALAGAASAQQPGYPYPWAGGGQPGFGFPQYGFPQSGLGGPAVMPNIYNPQTQPLSPYLNLFRGSNPATNYYYGVRPGTVGGAGSMLGVATMPAMGGNRAPFFPQLAAAPDPLTLPDASDGYTLPPAGHPVVFNNTLGYFPGGWGSGYGRGMMRPGLGGVSGMARPATRR